MPIARNLKRWSNFCMSEDTKKKKKNRFLLSNAFSVYAIRDY